MEELEKNITDAAVEHPEEEFGEAVSTQAESVEEDDPDAVYPLDSEKMYFSSDKLTLEDEDGPKTMKI